MLFCIGFVELAVRSGEAASASYVRGCVAQLAGPAHRDGIDYLVHVQERYAIGDVHGVHHLCHARDILMCGQPYARGHQVCRSGPVMSLRILPIFVDGIENATALCSKALPKAP